jgi:tetratricopeptide (TPR) repeat protein
LSPDPLLRFPILFTPVSMGDVRFRHLPLFLLLAALASLRAQAATILVLPFQNNSSYEDLNWVGASIAETLYMELGSSGQIVIDRATLQEGFRRLTLRSGARFTKATIVKLGQTLGADYVIYGDYDIHLTAGETKLRNSDIAITSHLIDLRKFREGQVASESGNLAELSRMEEHLSFLYASTLQPGSNYQAEQFTTPDKLIRLDAKESYIRGLLSTNADQKIKWFEQASALNRAYASPAFELGKLYLQRKDFRQAQEWLLRVPSGHPRYPEARFKLGLATYGAADYRAAAGYFKEVSQTIPLGEVFNNLGAAENRMNQPAAVEDFRRAADADRADETYAFNLGLALYKAGRYDEATDALKTAVERIPEDREANSLLERAEQREPFQSANGRPPGVERLKEDFDETTFKELKAMLQPSKP